MISSISLMATSTHATTPTRILVQDYSTWPPHVYCDLYTNGQIRIALDYTGTQHQIVTAENPVCYAPLNDAINIIPGR